MIEINKYKLVPAITATWGEITGDITKQQDLVDYVAGHGGGASVWGQITGDIEDQEDLAELLAEYATKEWVEGKGYITSSALSGYATQDWVGQQGYLVQSDLSQYATRQWVTGRGYITSDALTGYATEDWVEGLGYIDQIKTVNDQSLIGEGNIEISGLTPEQEDAIYPLMNPAGGMLYTRDLEGFTAYRYYSNTNSTEFKNYMYKLGVDVYCKVYQQLYRWDPVNFTFKQVCLLTMDNQYPLWMDDSGRTYMGYDYEVDLATGEVTQVDLGSDGRNIYSWYSYNYDNIFAGKNGIYLISGGSAFKFNESDQEFEEIPFETEVGFDIGYYVATKLVRYEGHLIMVDVGAMYEFNEYNDHVEIVEVTTPYFPVSINGSDIDSQFFHRVGPDQNYMYLKEYTHYELVEGQWVSRTVYYSDQPGTIAYYYGPGVEDNDYLIGYYGMTDNKVLVTTGQEGYERTDWVSPSSVTVDLVSDQNVSGVKSFNGAVRANGGLYIGAVNSATGSTQINLGKNTTEAQTVEMTIPGLFTVNGKDVATKDDCINNKEVTHAGPRFTNITNSPYDYVKENYWTTPSGRLFSTEMWGTTTYEFDGTEFNEIQLTTSIPGNSVKAVTTNGDLYAYYNGWLYSWDDVNDTWVQVCECNDDIWTVGSTIRSGSGYKLVNGEFVEDQVQDWMGPYSHLVNGNVYVNYSNALYQYDESTKTYTRLGSIVDWGTNNWFVLDDELYYTGADNVVYKIDLTRVGGSQDLNVATNIICRQSNQFYGTCQYGDYLYTAIPGQFGYCYDTVYELPVVPSTDGNYILRATRSGNSITYSWIPEV